MIAEREDEMTQVLEQHEVNTLEGLREILDRMSNNALHQIDNGCVCIVGAPLKVILEAETLTDRSEAYNLRFKL